MKKKLFFSLEGVDLIDDDAIDAFATQVWEHVTAAWHQQEQHQQEQDQQEHTNTTGESHE